MSDPDESALARDSAVAARHGTILFFLTLFAIESVFALACLLWL